MATTLEKGPIVAADSERPALREIEHVIANTLKSDEQHLPKLVGPHGEEIELPNSLFQVLAQLVYHLAHDRIVTVVPLSKELTTQEAADILNVSRPYVVKLLEAGTIPFTLTGTHRRIRFSDLMEYKKQRDAHRRQGLAHLTQMSEEMGLYD